MDFLRPFMEAAQRLADHGIVIHRLHTDWAAFGSWLLEAQRVGPHGRLVRGTWDGRDGALEIEQRGLSPASLDRFDSPVSALNHFEAFLVGGGGA